MAAGFPACGRTDGSSEHDRVRRLANITPRRTAQSGAGGPGARGVADVARGGAGGPAPTQVASRAVPIGGNDVLAGQRARRQRQEQRPEPDRADRRRGLGDRGPIRSATRLQPIPIHRRGGYPAALATAPSYIHPSDRGEDWCRIGQG